MRDARGRMGCGTYHLNMVLWHGVGGWMDGMGWGWGGCGTQVLEGVGGWERWHGVGVGMGRIAWRI